MAGICPDRMSCVSGSVFFHLCDIPLGGIGQLLIYSKGYFQHVYMTTRRVANVLNCCCHQYADDAQLWKHIM